MAPCGTCPRCGPAIRRDRAGMPTCREVVNEWVKAASSTGPPKPTKVSVRRVGNNFAFRSSQGVGEQSGQAGRASAWHVAGSSARHRSVRRAGPGSAASRAPGRVSVPVRSCREGSVVSRPGKPRCPAARPCSSVVEECATMCDRVRSSRLLRSASDQAAVRQGRFRSPVRT